MTSSQESKAVAKELFDAMAAGDGQKLDALLADDIVWDFPGNFDFSGTHVGKTAVFTDLIGAIDALYSPEGRALDVQAIIADGHLVAAEYIGHNVGKDGKKYENLYAWFLEIADGRVRRIRTHTDTLHIREVLSES